LAPPSSRQRTICPPSLSSSLPHSGPNATAAIACLPYRGLVYPRVSRHPVCSCVGFRRLALWLHRGLRTRPRMTPPTSPPQSGLPSRMCPCTFTVNAGIPESMEPRRSRRPSSEHRSPAGIRVTLH
jgi:hypothetical protein